MRMSILLVSGVAFAVQTALATSTATPWPSGTPWPTKTPWPEEKTEMPGPPPGDHTCFSDSTGAGAADATFCSGGFELCMTSPTPGLFPAGSCVAGIACSHGFAACLTVRAVATGKCPATSLEPYLRYNLEKASQLDYPELAPTRCPFGLPMGPASINATLVGGACFNAISSSDVVPLLPCFDAAGITVDLPNFAAPQPGQCNHDSWIGKAPAFGDCGVSLVQNSFGDAQKAACMSLDQHGWCVLMHSAFCTPALPECAALLSQPEPPGFDNCLNKHDDHDGHDHRRREEDEKTAYEGCWSIAKGAAEDASTCGEMTMIHNVFGACLTGLQGECTTADINAAFAHAGEMLKKVEDHHDGDHTRRAGHSFDRTTCTLASTFDGSSGAAKSAATWFCHEMIDSLEITATSNTFQQCVNTSGVNVSALGNIKFDGTATTCEFPTGKQAELTKCANRILSNSSFTRAASNPENKKYVPFAKSICNGASAKGLCRATYWRAACPTEANKCDEPLGETKVVKFTLVTDAALSPAAKSDISNSIRANVLKQSADAIVTIVFNERNLRAVETTVESTIELPPGATSPSGGAVDVASVADALIAELNSPTSSLSQQITSSAGVAPSGVSGDGGSSGSNTALYALLILLLIPIIVVIVVVYFVCVKGDSKSKAKTHPDDEETGQQRERQL